MSKQTINVGSSANDGTGDPNRTAFQKINANFTELYDGVGAGDLQQVTDNGNTTTNDITAGGFLSLGNANIPSINFNDAGDLDTSLGFLGADPSITTPRNWVLPDASGTIALTSDIPTVDETPNITITTSISIDTDTTGSGYSQHGRNTKISNGANAINLTVQTSSNADFIASYTKIGSSAITFVAGSGTTLVQLSGTAILSGAVGSTACLTRNGNVYYLQITNY